MAATEHVPVGEEAEVADAHETARQQVQQEAAQELVDRQAHDTLLVGMGGISPAEADVALPECDQSAVGDGDAMGVAAEIAQRVFRAAEGRLGSKRPSRGGTGIGAMRRSCAVRRAARDGRGTRACLRGRRPSVRRRTCRGRRGRVPSLAGRSRARRDPARVIGSEATGSDRRSGHVDEAATADSSYGAR